MPDTISREEFKSLEGRVSVVEREVDGEKMVSRYILEQARRNGDDIAGMKTRIDRVETRLDGVEVQLEGLRSEVRGVKQDLAGLRKDLPSIVGDTMRDVLKESRQA